MQEEKFSKNDYGRGPQNVYDWRLLESEDAGQFSPRSGPITAVLFGCQLSKLIVAADTLKVNNRKCFFVENEFLKCPPALSREIDSSQPRSQQTPALGS